MGFHPSDDGKVIDGKVVVYLKAPRRWGDPPPEQPGSKKAQTQAAGAEKKPGGARKDAAAGAKAEPDQSKVKNLRWSAQAALHGDEVEMLADAPEGASLLFTIERRAGTGRWEPLGSTKAKVDRGTARASMKLEHPGSLDRVHCRFRARLL